MKKIYGAVGVLTLLLMSTLVVGAQPPRPPQPAPVFDPNYEAVPNTYAGVGSVTQGEAVSIGDFSLTQNCNTRDRFFAAETGIIAAEDGTEWTVPMAVTEGLGALDMYNPCLGGDNPDYLEELETVILDEDGQDITGTIFGDNYFELFINGEFVARDTIGFVPFNSSAVRFRANYPYTIAVHLVDWDTHLGLGMEYDEYKVGDGGFIANFSDGTVTSVEWKCRPLYIAPLDDPACVEEDDLGNVVSANCPSTPECATQNAETCRALHYTAPDGWMTEAYDDSHWLGAYPYTPEQVTNQTAYVDYAERFGSAQFIWSSNLLLDNHVVCRLTVEAPR